MTRSTWDLKVPGESSRAIDNSERWNFSICSTNKQVMAILVEGCSKKVKNALKVLTNKKFGELKKRAKRAKES